MYIHIICMYAYIYIYIERERERERELVIVWHSNYSYVLSYDSRVYHSILIIVYHITLWYIIADRRPPGRLSPPTFLAVATAEMRSVSNGLDRSE